MTISEEIFVNEPWNSTQTYLKELELHDVVGTIAKRQDTKRSLTRTETTFRPGKALSLVGGIGLALLAGTAGIQVVSSVVESHGPLWGFLAALALSLSAVAAAMTIHRAKEKESSELEALTGTSEESRIGKFDLSPETLEFELREVVRELTRRDVQCVFVIDELDKLDIEQPEELPKPEEHPIFAIVSGLKNFFTLGAGLFVFISGEDFFTALERSISDDPYSLSHTLFTDRIFVHVLHYKDVERLIDELIATPPTASDEQLYRKFRNYLAWRSRNHVFDLLTLLGEYVTFDDEARPVLEALEGGPREGSWREGNLPEDWMDAAGLQKFVGASFDEGRRPSTRDARYNQSLYLTLRETAEDLLNGRTIEVRGDEYDLPETSWGRYLSETDRDDLAGAVQRMLVKMERHGAVVSSTNVVQDPATGQETESTTTYDLLEHPPYPPPIISQEATLIPFEESFLDLADRVSRTVGHLEEADIPLGTFANQVSLVSDLAKQIESTTPRATVPRSQVRTGIETADTVAARLIGHGIESVIRAWSEPQGIQLSDDVNSVEQRTGAAWISSLGEFTEFIGALQGSGVKYWILGSGSSESQLLVLLDFSGGALADLSSAYKQTLTGPKGRERRRLRLPVLAVVLGSPDEVPEIPEEVFDVIGESEGESLIALFRRVARMPKKRTGKLAGWHTFSLDPELANLNQLVPKIDQVSYLALEGDDE
jgi:hypothetical protein